MAHDHFPCHSCGTLTHIDDLDGKPDPKRGGPIYNLARRLWLWWTARPSFTWDDPSISTDWTRLECGACYGPGYVSNQAYGRASDGNTYRYHTTGLPPGGDRHG